MSMDSLNKRVEQMQMRAAELQPPERKPLAVHLFTTGERAGFDSFVESIEAKLDTGERPYQALTDAEFETLTTWADLAEALDREDLTSAQRYRRWLSDFQVEQS